MRLACFLTGCADYINAQIALLCRWSGVHLFQGQEAPTLCVGSNCRVSVYNGLRGGGWCSVLEGRSVIDNYEHV